MVDPRVTRAVRHGGVAALDGRGLMPLAEARAALAGADAFVRGDADDHVLASDRLWAALLSLEDAAELVEVASRLDWRFHPRGFDNVDLHLRYGDGIVPWLATRVDGDGTLVNVPWCVVPCLLACGSDDAFELAWRVRRVRGGRVGDLAVAWRRRHPAAAARLLAARAGADARARAHLRAIAAAPAGPPRADDVLALLDACAARLVESALVLWPRAAVTRAVAARDGDDWGLALEVIEGTRATGIRATRVQTFAYGSRVRGAIAGAAVTSRAMPLGEPPAALAALGLAAPRIVAVVPHLATDVAPSDAAAWRALAVAIAA